MNLPNQRREGGRIHESPRTEEREGESWASAAHKRFSWEILVTNWVKGDLGSSQSRPTVKLLYFGVFQSYVQGGPSGRGQGFVYINGGSSDCQLDCRASYCKARNIKQNLVPDHTGHPVLYLWVNKNRTFGRKWKKFQFQSLIDSTFTSAGLFVSSIGVAWHASFIACIVWKQCGTEGKAPWLTGLPESPQGGDSVNFYFAPENMPQCTPQRPQSTPKLRKIKILTITRLQQVCTHGKIKFLLLVVLLGQKNVN